VSATLLGCRPDAKDPGEHRGSECHRQVGKIEGPEAMSADSDIDEVDHSTRGANAVEEIANCASANESDGGDLHSVFTRGLSVHVGENEQGTEREHDEPPA